MALEEDGFAPVERIRAFDDPAWGEERPLRPDTVRARRTRDGFEVRLDRALVDLAPRKHVDLRTQIY